MKIASISTLSFFVFLGIYALLSYTSIASAGTPVILEDRERAPNYEITFDEASCKDKLCGARVCYKGVCGDQSSPLNLVSLTGNTEAISSAVDWFRTLCTLQKTQVEQTSRTLSEWGNPLALLYIQREASSEKQRLVASLSCNNYRSRATLPRPGAPTNSENPVTYSKDHLCELGSTKWYTEIAGIGPNKFVSQGACCNEDVQGAGGQTSAVTGVNGCRPAPSVLAPTGGATTLRNTDRSLQDRLAPTTATPVASRPPIRADVDIWEGVPPIDTSEAVVPETSAASRTLPQAALRARNLSEFYTATGERLPSRSDRAQTWEELGLGSASEYRGRGSQNQQLLEALQGGRALVSTPTVGASTRVATTALPTATQQAQNLGSFFSSLNRNLPSVTSRRSAYARLGFIDHYSGTATQNIQFLRELQKRCTLNGQSLVCN